MTTAVLVNKLTIVHMQSGGTANAFPDVCLVPTPTGAVPVPFPNMAVSQQTMEGSQTVMADGLPFMLKTSNFATSSGDEAGVIGGVASGCIKGKALPRSYSFDVKVEGENVFRMSDVMGQNATSSPNTPPATLVQPNQVAMSKQEATRKTPEVVSIAFSPSTALCGDEVTLEVKSKDAQDQTLSLTPRGMSVALSVQLEGDRAEEKILVRRGPYEKEKKLQAGHCNPGGSEIKSNELVVDAHPTAASEAVGPTRMESEQWLLDKATGKLSPTGKIQRWYAFYEIELKPGELVVTRKIDLEPKQGARAPTEQQKAAWRSEIERIWDGRFEFHRKSCQRGDRCDCPAEWGCCTVKLRVRAEFGPVLRPGVEKVSLFPGACNRDGWASGSWWAPDAWWEDRRHAPATVRAHNFGHLIGMYDEHPQGACDPDREYTDEPKSIMGSGPHVFERHVERFHEWLDRKLGGEFGETVVRRCR